MKTNITFYLADNQTTIVANEARIIEVRDTHDKPMTIYCAVTDQMNEDMVIGMNVLGDPKGFTVRPEDSQVDINRTENDTTEMFTFPITREDNLRAFRMEDDDVLKDEDLFGVPPESKGKKVIEKKTWRNALGHDPKNDPNYKITTPERLEVIWEELRMGTHPDSLHLNKEQTERVRGLLTKFGHIFRNEVCPVDKSIGTHKIKLKPGQEPISSRQYPLAPRQRQAVKDFVNNMKRQNLIRDAASPWNSPLLAVPKPDGELRICFD
eukprot:Stramenopile-MAST_4_protein_6346